MKKKLFLFAICHLLFVVFLTGCARKDNAGGPKDLVMWLVGSESQAKAIQNIGDEFFKDKGINFKCGSISWNDAHTKYLTCIAGGVAPDIGTFGLTWGTEFGSLGAMLDLAAEFPAESKAIMKKIAPGFKESIESKGKIYGVPFDLSLQVMFYRNDIISKPPATWQNMEDLLLGLKAKGKGMIFEWGSLSWIGYAPFLWQAGGDFYNKEHTLSTLDSRQAAEALKFFSRLYTDLGVPKANVPLEQGMRTGDFPLAISGTWNIDNLRLSAPEIKDKWSIALLPAGPSGRHTAFLGGRVMGIFSKSKNKYMAWEFIKHLFEPDIQLKLYEAARMAQDSYLPSNTQAWDALPMEAEFKRILKLQAEDAKGPPSVLAWDKSTRFIENAIQRVVLEAADIKAELAKTAQQLDRLIKK